MPNHPLAEVFGFPVDNDSDEAKRYRDNRLCPYNNKVPNCTKDKASHPLGVCSIYSGDGIAITYPIRLRERWLIAQEAASFIFPQDTRWTTLTEVRLKDSDGKVAGNIDIVLVAYNDQGKIIDFGSLEVQAVYISGNIRAPFEHYMQDPAVRADMDWRGQANYPRADYLSSSRKRLLPQLLYKGAILSTWKKRQAVAMHKDFYGALPALPEVKSDDAEMAWLLYDLVFDDSEQRYQLESYKTVYTAFRPALLEISTPRVGEQSIFVEHLQKKLDAKFDSGISPDTTTIIGEGPL
ncbi:MAG: NotI family restriction endonuclease [Trueperaceae bacterium]|nr:NotI family restriction endonuclease [Trueperaceae bacterium]